MRNFLHWPRTESSLIIYYTTNLNLICNIEHGPEESFSAIFLSFVSPQPFSLFLLLCFSWQGHIPQWTTLLDGSVPVNLLFPRNLIKVVGFYISIFIPKSLHLVLKSIQPLALPPQREVSLLLAILSSRFILFNKPAPRLSLVLPHLQVCIRAWSN